MRMTGVILGAALTVGLARPAAAADKETRQMMADIRILQEQSQQLQNLLTAMTDALKAVNARIDEQTGANRKSFADQKLVIDTSRATCASFARRWTTATCGLDPSDRNSTHCVSR